MASLRLCAQRLCACLVCGILLPPRCATVELKDLPEFLRETHSKNEQKKSRLILGEPVLDLTPDNFTLEAKNRNSSIVVGFFSKSCGWCRRAIPAFIQVAEAAKEGHRFGAVDDRAFREIGDEFGVSNLPAFVTLKPGANGAYTKYYGPHKPEDIQMWMCMQTGLLSPCAHIATRKKLMWIIVHVAIGSLAYVMKSLGLKVTDHGSGGGPLRDGGTLGVAGIVLGCLVAFFCMLCCCCKCLRRKRGEKTERKTQ
mmetsp:Transcript_42111/g.78256  ORF Transcript_42111/g.78256 Transcript_42111/m.78256 type:complete len:254 (-) Transcript_42111:37-798(-)